MSRGSKAPRTLAEQIADLDDPTPRDLDPEDHHVFEQNRDEESGDSDQDSQVDGREHYETVGKGKLRKVEEVTLGKQYEGLNISRDALDVDDDSDDDPFGKGASGSDATDEEDDGDYDDPDAVELAVGNGNNEDEDIESDEAFGESDVELQKRFKFLGSSERGEMNGRGRPDPNSDEDADSAEEEEEEEEEEGDENEPDEDDDFEGMDVAMEDGSLSESEEDAESEQDDSIESEDTDEEPMLPQRASPGDDRAALRKLMASDQKTVAATISQAAKVDAAKGQAVKQQRSTFDALLNTRIKLQKSLVSINSISIGGDNVAEGNLAVAAAENAAMALWSNLEDLRQQLADVQKPDSVRAGQKRKRPSQSAASSDVWAHMQSHESASIPHRRSVLDKWSSKVRAATASDGRGKLMPKADQQGIIAVLDSQLTTEAEKLVKRTKIARSAAPDVQSKKGTTMTDDASIFDDTDFYQLLLRELVEQRMDSSSTQAGVVPIATSLRATRVKKSVDTKASKGRKMRYTVHEKLQNFMAPEDRGTWTEKAQDEFFGSLLGGRADKALREEDEESEDGQEAEALRLFRTSMS